MASNLSVKILKILKTRRGNFLSGSTIGKNLKVTRSAVWKGIQELISQGYQIESAPKRGYRLVALPDLLVAEEIEEALRGKRIGHRVHIFEEVTSTSDMAAQLADKGAQEGEVVVAERQSRGRGRLGRSWHSMEGRGIWASIILKPPIVPIEAPRVTFLTAVAIAHLIKARIGLEAFIKWPNDIYIGQKKVCGILNEMVAEQDRVKFLIVGLGLNVNHQEGDFPPSLASVATSLRIEAQRPFRRSELLIELLKGMNDEYELFLKKGFEAIREQWKRLCSTIGRRVKAILSEDVTIEGVAVGIDQYGSLLIKTPEGQEVPVLFGDVIHLE